LFGAAADTGLTKFEPFSPGIILFLGRAPLSQPGARYRPRSHDFAKSGMKIRRAAEALGATGRQRRGQETAAPLNISGSLRSTELQPEAPWSRMVAGAETQGRDRSVHRLLPAGNPLPVWDSSKKA
jgi:hypothetical protein